MSIEETLKDRGHIYGEFTTHAELSQAIKTAMWSHDGWINLSAEKREALEMMAHKIARIVNGNPDYADSWVDVAGYAQLVVDRLSKEGEAA